MKPPAPHADRSRRVLRWSLAAALLALAPKCLLCAVVYAGLGSALGVGAQEICSSSSGLQISWLTVLAFAGIVLGGIRVVAGMTNRRLHQPGQR